jgi:hypothetical protein
LSATHSILPGAPGGGHRLREEYQQRANAELVEFQSIDILCARARQPEILLVSDEASPQGDESPNDNRTPWMDSGESQIRPIIPASYVDPPLARSLSLPRRQWHGAGNRLAQALL